MTTDYAVARTWLKELRDDQQHWNAGMRRAEELFQAAEAAAKDLAGAEQRQATLAAEIPRLTAEQTQLAQAVASRRAELDGLTTAWRQEHRAARLAEEIADKTARSAALDGEIADRLETKAALDADLTALKSKHGL